MSETRLSVIRRHRHATSPAAKAAEAIEAAEKKREAAEAERDEARRALVAMTEKYNTAEATSTKLRAQLEENENEL